MRVFDFDGAVYSGNMTREFYWFSLKRHPRILRYLPGQLWALFCYWFGSKTQTDFWQVFYRYFVAIPDLNALVSQFWDKGRLEGIKQVYRSVHSPGDLILTSLPECLVAPVCRELDAKLLGSQVDPESGVYHGPCRHGREKLRCYRQKYPGEPIEVFWSAHLSDRPVAMEAVERRVVRGDQVMDWEDFEAREAPRKKWLRTWISPEFFRFWCVGWLNMASAWILEASWSLILPPNIAFAIGYFMSLLVSFVLNSKITFQAPLTVHRLLRFILSYIPNFIVQSLTVFLVHNVLGLPHLLAYILAAIAGTPVTFICLKLFAFRKRVS